MFQLRFTTVVEAPLTVAFDVARTLGRPWGTPLDEVVSVRPVRDVFALPPGHGFRWLTHSRRFSATGAGTLVLHRRFDVERCVEAIEAERVTIVTGVPTIYIALLNARVPPVALASVRFYKSAAATMPVEIARRWHDA